MNIDSVIRLNNLTKKYGKVAGIQNVSLEIIRGEIFGFLGPNGAGKSTAINCMLGTLKATSGTIEILNQKINVNSYKVHKDIGYLSGDMETDPNLTGDQYIEYTANLRGGFAKYQSKIDELKKRLDGDTAKKIKHMSRGNRQKVGLITALMHDPELLILDEPTSGLDPLMQATFNEIIIDHSNRGKTTFMSSHILSEVESICHRVGFIRDGQLVAVDSLANLRQKSIKRISVRSLKTLQLSELLKGTSGINHLDIQDNALIFDYQGNINLLLKILAKHVISDVTISDSDLEQMFLGYYQDENDV